MSALSAASISLNKPQLNVVNGTDREPKLMEWLWHKRVGLGTLTLFTGLPGQAKSLCTIDLAATLSKGRSCFGDGAANTTSPCDTLFLSTEDAIDDTQLPRFLLAGGDRSRIHWIESKRAAKLDAKGNKSIVDQLIALDNDLPLIEDWLVANPEVRLLVIDPISGHLGSRNMNKDQEMRQVLQELAAMAARLRIAVIFVVHVNKKSDLDAMQRVSGAGAFVAVARSSWIFAESADDPELYQMLPLKNNNTSRATGGLEFRLESMPMTIDGKTDTFPVISWKGVTLVRATDALSHKREGGKLNDAQKFLQEFLADGPKTCSEVFAEGDKLDFCERTLYRAKEKLGVESVKDGPGGWIWNLPILPVFTS